ncbi:MAG TPA: phospho-sugar mutase [Candidatus Anaerostipes avistercoris]|uniref:Phosphoglucomutase n=1 Tax=Candidatus Anaerostipes avistercoris TaxID=2838462 RepID=A0A9D2T894_9FIRM|nr:phospho-sugar mutase [Candidatus Anaerostipes avistercoris]
MNYKETYQEWLSNPYFDEDTKKELKAIKNDDNEIKERFYADLAFGTAGLRGIIGAGINRMNIYVVRKATQGLADYISEQNTDKKRVAIAFDSRHMSPEFADEAARCLAANGIKAFIFESLRPTPELSFAVRHLDCIAGINITASHNPPAYNGYKVYWEDGAQFTDPHASGVTAKVNAITDISTCKTISKEEAMNAGLYEVIGAEVDDAYIAEVEKQVFNQKAIDEMSSKLKIVYTPLHGTGNLPVRRVLSDLGFENVYVVPEQELPNGDFPTVSYPNPEAKEAFELGLALAKEKDADLVLATDPDADRLGVYVKDSKSGDYIPLTGNMSGSLLCEYVLSQRKAINGSLPEDGAVVKSIVTTNLVDAIADAYNVKLIEVLTGFKWIGKEILGFEKSGKGTYLFGLEESYGCLIGTYARDKDAVSATVALCEAAAYYATQGKTLWDIMLEMYEKYGYYLDRITAMDFPGLEGMDKMQSMLNAFRENPPKEIAGYKVEKVRDYSNDTILDVSTGETSPIGLPNSNVLYYELEGGAWVCVRPSGTEPKIKFYYGVKADSMEAAQAESDKLDAWAKSQG